MNILSKRIFKVSEMEIEIVDNNERSVQTFQVKTAQYFLEQIKGLQGKDKIENNEGMLFIFETPQSCNFGMKDVEFPLDIIFIDRTKTIIHIAEKQKPFSDEIITSPLPVKCVLEIKGGLCREKGIKLNYKVKGC